MYITGEAEISVSGKAIELDNAVVTKGSITYIKTSWMWYANINISESGFATLTLKNPTSTDILCNLSVAIVTKPSGATAEDMQAYYTDKLDNPISTINVKKANTEELRLHIDVHQYAVSGNYTVSGSVDV